MFLFMLPSWTLAWYLKLHGRGSFVHINIYLDKCRWCTWLWFQHGEGPLYPTTQPSLSWLETQKADWAVKGSEVKLILSETGWRWASWIGGVGGVVTCPLLWLTGKVSRGSLQRTKKPVVTRGESGWLANSVTTWYNFLKAARENRRWRGERIKMERIKMCWGGLFKELSLNYSDVIQRYLKIHQWKLKIFSF